MFKLSLKNIKNSFNSYRGMYALLIVSQLVSILILLFVYGIIASYDIQKEAKLRRDLFFDAILKEPVPVKELKDVWSDILDQIDTEMHYSCMEAYHPDFMVTCIMDYHNGRFSIPSEFYPVQRLKEGRYISEEEMNDGSMVAFAYSDSSEFTVGEYYELYGAKYEIVGVIDGNKAMTVPLNSCADNVLIKYVGISFEGFPSQREYDIFHDSLSELYGDNLFFTDFKVVDLDDIIVYDSIIILACAIGVIAALDTILVYNYLMKKRKKQMAIFSIEGATRWNQIAICEIEILLITITSTLAGVVIFKSAIENILMEVYDISMDIFNPRIYCIVLGIYTSCIILGTFFVVFINTRKKALEVRRG